MKNNYQFNTENINLYLKYQIYKKYINTSTKYIKVYI